MYNGIRFVSQSWRRLTNLPLSVMKFLDGNDPQSCYNGKAPFIIDPDTGIITTTVRLFWNCTDTVILTVSVTRRNGSRADTGATKQVVITIEPIDESDRLDDFNQNVTCRSIRTTSVPTMLTNGPPT